MFLNKNVFVVRNTNAALSIGGDTRWKNNTHTQKMAIKNLTTTSHKEHNFIFITGHYFFMCVSYTRKKHTHTSSHIKKVLVHFFFMCKMMKWKCFMPAWASFFVMDAVCACHHYNECKAFFHLCFVMRMPAYHKW